MEARIKRKNVTEGTHYTQPKTFCNQKINKRVILQNFLQN
ncbi:hypothetical protein F542_13820 [Bibersteinia trehalosi USDA-ARS-USMARC-188]|uniref:Uncharacterized protein n=3 Tax=Bibersteinia trehalosi TaxID=47735 RepID=W0R6J3_BIBTR|nr:hypothetical protein WQG_8220 [Bibersteinia trehalosi USDA-ARS-USMARC-192]AHG82100.1 hypothetical protein F542_13820 [Bibersteinia trehalosi USDA-ARS-USMARC-188]AHG84408.1 hypothetical protein F543_15440 [Bibersteinia trehalosi USDA-ARS-USMARC-189]AHG86077.1 hypothetical protein F544_8480 [Bibersteinia trehalosi USDA-ARS-USMARC-190]